MMSLILELNKEKWFNKVVRFVSDRINKERIKKAYYLKTINETAKIVSDLKEIVDAGSYLKLALLKNDTPYNFDRLDGEGVVEVVESFYELYLVIDVDDNYYFVIIKENNFFRDKPINELEYIKKVTPFWYKVYFFNRKRINN